MSFLPKSGREIKFRYVSKLTTSLASLASESTGSVFTSRDLLKKILSTWESGEECDIQNDGGQ